MKFRKIAVNIERDLNLSFDERTYLSLVTQWIIYITVQKSFKNKEIAFILTEKT